MPASRSSVRTPCCTCRTDWTRPAVDSALRHRNEIRSSERLPDAEIQAASRLAGSRIEHKAVVAAQQQPWGPQANADSGRLAKIGQGKIADFRKHVSDIEEHHAIEHANEWHPQLVI